MGLVIHSAVMAACLWQLPGIRTHLVAFDTSVVDLTADVADPVELLMKYSWAAGPISPVPWSMVGNLLNNQQKASLSS